MAQPLSQPEWMTLVLFVVQVLIAIILTLLGFFMKQVTGDLKQVAGELRDFQKDVHLNGVMKPSFDEYRKEMRSRVHNIADRLGAIEGAMRVLHKIELPIRTGGNNAG